MGDALANALMKAGTKSKRRVTLSIAALGWLDETEVETIPRVNLTTVGSDPLQEGEEKASGPLEVHPPAEEITTLVDSARSAHVSNEDFATTCGGL